MDLSIPPRLVESCASAPERADWLTQLPFLVGHLARRWSLSVGEPFDASCAWVAPVVRADGTRAVIKVNMPHFEAAQEVDGLRFWAGDPTVRLLEADDDWGAMVLERCHPGVSLHSMPEPKQDQVIARLLRRMWRVPSAASTFRRLSAMVAYWCDETRQYAGHWPDPGVVEDGLRVFEELAAGDHGGFLLATDLHAGNVLAAKREPWLAIDPKPFTGDPAYDATQHLLNCMERVRADPEGTVTRFARLLDVDPERVRLWLFARVAAEPREVWDATAIALARLLRS